MEGLSDICGFFGISAREDDITPFGSGHINRTFLIEGNSGDGIRKFLLQRINTNVFNDVEGLMENAILVTGHIESKLLSDANRDQWMKVVRFIPGKNGDFIYNSEDGSCWRMMEFVEGSHSYDVVANQAIAREGGKAFGGFLAMLQDFDPRLLQITLPCFHDMKRRLDDFYLSIRTDSNGRAASVAKEIEFVRYREKEMIEFQEWYEAGHIPVRITHNDTKVNNLLFDINERAFCVIDLDTLMPGFVFHDFGDAIRTFACTSAEDEKDLSLTGFNMDYFKAFTVGYLAETRHILTPEEKSHLVFSARYMTFIIGLRFLTDYLNGDIYYKVSHSHHNLDRARVQFRLLEEMEKRSVELETLLKQIA